MERARLTGGNIDSALAALRENERRVPRAAQMEARFRLWQLTGDQTHLGEAPYHLVLLIEHAPEDCRTSMIENVPLHRDVMRAWEEHGGDA